MLESPIELKETQCNVLVVENNQIYSKLVYSLYNKEDDYLKLFDKNYKDLKEKDLVVIFNPLSFDFNERSIKKVFYDEVIYHLNQDIEGKQEIENEYQKLIRKIISKVEDQNELELIYDEAVDFPNLFKLFKLEINQEIQGSIFEKVQLLVNTLNELVGNRLLIFMNLNILLSNEEYRYLMEQVNLNNQTVLIIESSQYSLEGIPHWYLDNDFYLIEVGEM